MISAVSARGKLHFTFVEGKVNADAFIAYLKKLLHDINGKIFLIIDGRPARKAAKVRQLVEQTNGRLELYLLPPYSPELNPDEWVWKNIKVDTVGKVAIKTIDELRAAVEMAVTRLGSTKEIAEGVFRVTSPELHHPGQESADESSDLVAA